ncbi:MAG TPA: M50 family metallopeptidase [Candidatus Binatia bacterium]|nr:M50 family metallopeptidase [Candidatus Binatia bacterium]
MSALLQGLVGLLLFVVVLGLLVLVHEIGHFVVARRAGVRVHEFGIGFPPRAAVLRSDGETLYTLNWLPIGGFVKLEGEEGESDDPRSFVRAPFLTKQAILAAGVAMNVLFAAVIFVAVAWLPQQAVGLSFRQVQPDSPAAAAGLRPGDRIVAIDGRLFDAYDGPLLMVEALRAKAGERVTLGILRDGTYEEVATTLRRPEELGPERGALGIVDLRAELTDRTFGRDPVAAVATGLDRTGRAFGLILGGLADLGRSLIAEPTAPPPAAGPVGIATQIADVFWQAGPVATLYVAAILSANLALVNILPIPPLDGGRMLMLVLRAVAGRRLSVRVEQLTYLVGFVLLFGFLIWLTAFDVSRLAGGQP